MPDQQIAGTSMFVHIYIFLQELKEKKRWGRLQKAKGDWALLAGSPRDAFEHYKSGMELSKAAADAIWCVRNGLFNEFIRLCTCKSLQSSSIQCCFQGAAWSSARQQATASGACRS
jgi:hypothetical protein